MKKLLLIPIVLLALVAGGWFVYGNVIIKRAFESYGERLTQTKVELGSAVLSPFSGSGSLYGIVIGNPSGFETPEALRLGKVSVTLDNSSLLSKQVVIEEATIADPVLVYEIGLAGNNIDALRRTIAQRARVAGEGASSAGEGPKRFIIRNLHITGGKVRLHTRLMQQANQQELTLPDMHLRNLGEEQGGAGAGEIAAEILASVATQLSQMDGEALQGQLKNMKNVLKNQLDDAKGALDGLLGQ